MIPINWEAIGVITAVVAALGVGLAHFVWSQISGQLAAFGAALLKELDARYTSRDFCAMSTTATAERIMRLEGRVGTMEGNLAEIVDELRQSMASNEKAITILTDLLRAEISDAERE